MTIKKIPNKLQKTEKNIIHITGMGIVSAIGKNIKTFTTSLITGKSGITYSNRFTIPPLIINIAAEIQNFNCINLINSITNLPKQISEIALYHAHHASFTLKTSIISTLEAWKNANLLNNNLNNIIKPERIGLIIAGHNTTQNDQYTLHKKFQKNPEYLSPRYALQFMDSNQIGVISEIFNIKGEGLVCGGASASGNIGIIQGSRLIKTNIVDICLVLGVMTHLSPMEIQSLHAIGAMGGKIFHAQPQKSCRPFDTQHEGFIYGQASACLILESEESVKKRNIISLARLLGGAITLDATSSPKSSCEGEINVMHAALQQSKIKPTNIDYINTHGSSSPLGDYVELKAIEQVFGKHFPKLWLNATKGLCGHCFYSAGVVEAIATIIQIQKGFIHPNLNLENPIKNNAKFNGVVATQTNITTAMSNSFAFSGINSSIILQKI